MARSGSSTQAGDPGHRAWRLPFRVQAIVLVALALGLYANTLRNGYALDDKLMIVENPDTRRGIAGLPAIFTNDAYAHHYERTGSAEALAGGRYRPLSAATFAIEWSLFAREGPDGTLHGSPGISHAINALLYAITAVLLLLLLHRFWLPDRPLVAFLAAFLFTLHPVHTEVVANIKGRDELLSVLFLLMALILLWRTITSPSIGITVSAASCYLLALLSKENGITLLAVIPLALRWSADLSWRRIMALTFPFVAVAMIFLVIRTALIGVVGGENGSYLNDPFLFATPAQRVATIMVCLLAYLKLLVWPHPLAYEYGFHQFEYAGPGDAVALFSVALHLGLVAAAWQGLRRRREWAFGIAFYLITLSIVSNLVVPTGTTIGERFLYLPSIGAMIAFAALLARLIERIPASVLTSSVAVMAPLTVAAGAVVVQRNGEWKDDLTLVLADVEKVPRSVKAASNAGTELLLHAIDSANVRTRDQELRQAMTYLRRAIALQKDIPREKHFPASYLDLGTCHVLRREFVDAASNYLIVEPDHRWFRENRTFAVEAFLNACVEAREKGDFANCELFLARAEVLGAGEIELVRGRGDLAYRKGEMPLALEHYRRWTVLAPNDPAAWMNLGGFLFTMKDKAGALAALQRTLELDPSHQEATQAFAAAQALP